MPTSPLLISRMRVTPGGPLHRPTWRQYQERAAAVFARLGCAALVDAKLGGARSAHKIDVLVRFTRWGIPQIWILECKYQKRRVAKSAVETLKSIIHDVGAEKGFLLSEVGFQPAAVSAAKLTNVSLLSLKELETGATPDVQQYLLVLLERETLALMKLAKDLIVEVERGPTGAMFRARPGVQYPGGPGMLGSLAGLLSALQGIKTGDYNNAIPRAFPDLHSSVLLPNADAVLSEGFRLVSEIKLWLSKQEQRMQKAARRLAATQRHKPNDHPNDAV
jgi:hypothetical protein